MVMKINLTVFFHIQGLERKENSGRQKVLLIAGTNLAEK